MISPQNGPSQQVSQSNNIIMKDYDSEAPVCLFSILMNQAYSQNFKKATKLFTSNPKPLMIDSVSLLKQQIKTKQRVTKIWIVSSRLLKCLSYPIENL